MHQYEILNWFVRFRLCVCVCDRKANAAGLSMMQWMMWKWSWFTVESHCFHTARYQGEEIVG